MYKQNEQTGRCTNIMNRQEDVHTERIDRKMYTQNEQTGRCTHIMNRKEDVQTE